RAVRPRERDDLAAAKLERRAVEHRAVVRERDLVDVADDVTDDRYLVRTRYRSEPRGSVLGEPGDSIVAGSIEDDPPRFHEDDPRRMGKRRGRALLGDDRGGRAVERVREEGFRPLGVELRRRLVEEEQLRLERDGRREAHALQLAAREL